jgi:hypothetical protein
MLPIIASLLSSGLSLTANAALAKGIEWVEKETGLDLSGPDSKLTPEQLTQVKQWELENEVKLMQLRVEDNRIDAEIFKAEIADKGSARQREVEMAKISQAPWFVPSVTTVLALIVVIGGGYMFFRIEDKDTRYAIVATVTTVLAYYFGTTARSGKKDDVIARLSDKG